MVLSMFMVYHIELSFSSRDHLELTRPGVSCQILVLPPFNPVTLKQSPDELLMLRQRSHNGSGMRHKSEARSLHLLGEHRIGTRRFPQSDLVFIDNIEVGPLALGSNVAGVRHCMFKYSL